MDDKEIKEIVQKKMIYSFTSREREIIDLAIPLARADERLIQNKKWLQEVEFIRIELKQKDKIIQEKDRAYSKEIRNLNLTIEKLRKYETDRVLKERQLTEQRIRKELEKIIQDLRVSSLGIFDTDLELDTHNNTLLEIERRLENFWERILNE